MLKCLVDFNSLTVAIPFYRFLVSSSSFQFSSYLTKNPNKTMNKVWKNIKSRKNCREFPVFELVTDRLSTWVILFGNLIPQLEGNVCISGWQTRQVLWSYRNIVRHGKHETNKERANSNEILFSVFIRFKNKFFIQLKCYDPLQMVLILECFDSCYSMHGIHPS